MLVLPCFFVKYVKLEIFKIGILLYIWIDGDACPKKIKEILFKAAVRTKTKTIIVANHAPKIPASLFISSKLVESGFDMADQAIIHHVEKGDLVITADIPLANAVIERKAFALNPRGQLYTEKNIKQVLSIRDFHTSLRDSGIQTGGEDALGQTEIRKFASELDKFLNK